MEQNVSTSGQKGLVGGRALPSSPGASARHPMGFWRRLWANRLAYIFLAPPVAGFLLFFAWPTVFALYASFWKFNNFKFVALPSAFDNYTRALSDGMIQRAFLNVFELFAISFVGSQVLSLLVAVLLNNIRRFAGLFRTLYYLPMVTSVVIVGALFKFILRNDPGGPANLILHTFFGIAPIRWLQEVTLVIPSIALVSIWAGVGGSIIVWTAGLKGVPLEIYEAATIDGANRWRQFWSVTLPMLKPVVMYQAVLGFIGGMKAFGLNYTMTPLVNEGQPPVAGVTPVYVIWHYGFRRMQMGYASAVAFLLSLVILAISLVQLRFFGSPDLYD
jgi:multiple sugar transport system permease protein